MASRRIYPDNLPPMHSKPNAAAAAAHLDFLKTGPMHLQPRTGYDPETSHDRSRKKTTAPLPRRRPKSY